MYDTLLQSGYGELVRSPMYDLETQAMPPVIYGQHLRQYKVWPGLYRIWSVGTTPIDYRKHWDNLTASYSYSSASYFATHYFTGLGHVARISDMPATISYGGTFNYNGLNLNNYWDYAIVTAGLTGLDSPEPLSYFSWRSFPGTATESAYSYELRVWYFPTQDPSTWHEADTTPEGGSCYPAPVAQTISLAMTGDVPFSTYFGVCSDRLLARTWPDWDVWQDGSPAANLIVTHDEHFDEWQGETIPANDPYTGDPVEGLNAYPLKFMPKFGANKVTQGLAAFPEASLCSLWMWPDAYGFGRVIACGRTRFKVSEAVDYFYAIAKLTAAPVTGQATINLGDVVAIETGALLADTTYEIPFPTEVENPPDGCGELTEGVWGWIVFCILGETPYAWGQRTGIAIDF